ncbi:hypothetical protein GE061_018700 [Apolygus lucorum]|uniref:Uncharacterized protein n=1 Tax=Apolygus lucorum TaxID=248454 RepID=A0A8S9X620_APOLU|nr:hypothetical protein GE061_018700 [Apolygus lucorum]
MNNGGDGEGGSGNKVEDSDDHEILIQEPKTTKRKIDDCMVHEMTDYYTYENPYTPLAGKFKFTICDNSSTVIYLKKILTLFLEEEEIRGREDGDEESDYSNLYTAFVDNRIHYAMCMETQHHHEHDVYPIPIGSKLKWSFYIKL